MCQEQIGLSDWTNRVLKCRHIFSTFMQSKHRIRLVALMLLLPTKATTEEKTNTCTNQCRPTYHRGPQIIQGNFDSRIKSHHNQHRQRKRDRKTTEYRMGRSHWVTDFYLQLQRTLNMSCCHTVSPPISFEFLTSRALHCWENNGFS